MIYTTEELRNILEEKYLRYNNPSFIAEDPIRIPHMFSEKENKEIAGFLTATIAWGQRTTIIKSALRLMQLLDNAPFDFIMHAEESDFQRLSGFCHRTFNDTDAQFFLKSIGAVYRFHGGLENIFTRGYRKNKSIFEAISFFRNTFLEETHLLRVEKHIADVQHGASAKRINMFLRWMIRNDDKGVDFGLWKEIPPSALQIPLDLHTGNVARALGLLRRKQNDRKAVEELTQVLQSFDPMDPIRFDFALFGMGVMEGMGK